MSTSEDTPVFKTLDELVSKELKALCRRFNISGYSKLNKEGLQETLTKYMEDQGLSVQAHKFDLSLQSNNTRNDSSDDSDVYSPLETSQQDHRVISNTVSNVMAGPSQSVPSSVIASMGAAASVIASTAAAASVPSTAAASTSTPGAAVTTSSSGPNGPIMSTPGFNPMSMFQQGNPFANPFNSLQFPNQNVGNQPQLPGGFQPQQAGGVPQAAQNQAQAGQNQPMNQPFYGMPFYPGMMAPQMMAQQMAMMNPQMFGMGMPYPYWNPQGNNGGFGAAQVMPGSGPPPVTTAATSTQQTTSGASGTSITVNSSMRDWPVR